LALFSLKIRVSETLFFRFYFDYAFETDEMKIHAPLPGIKLQILKKFSEFRNYSYFSKKLIFLPIEEWFSKGALCLAIIYKFSIIGYTWLHPKQYFIQNAGAFLLKDEELFFGPAFIDKKYRRKGLYLFLITNSLKYCMENRIKHLYSSSSIENTPSIKSLVRCGFNVVACVRAKYRKEREIIEFNKENLILLRLE
jgi:hypothetical protein